MINILTVLNDVIHKSKHDYEFRAILTTGATYSEERNIPVYHAQVALRCIDTKRQNYCDINVIRKTGYSILDIDINDLYNIFYATLYQNIIFGKATNGKTITTKGKTVFMFANILELVLNDKELPI